MNNILAWAAALFIGSMILRGMAEKVGDVEPPRIDEVKGIVGNGEFTN